MTGWNFPITTHFSTTTNKTATTAHHGDHRRGASIVEPVSPVKIEQCRNARQAQGRDR